jgi:hypothetical protein
VTRDLRDLSVLKSVCDIAQTVRALGAVLDWRVVANRAIQWKAGHAVFLMLHLAREWLAAPVPPEPLRELQPSSVTPVLEWARERILATPMEDHCPGDEPTATSESRHPTSSTSRALHLLTATRRWIRRRASLQDRRAKNHLALRAWLHSSG